MRRLQKRLTPALVLAMIALLLAAGGTAGAANAATGPATIRITNREISRVRVDAGRPGRGPGDMEIIRQNLFNKRIKSRPIGHADLVCTFVTSRTRHCMATYFLSKGRVVAGGSIRFPELYELAVLGGTRLYDNARGTLTVIRTTRRPRRAILVFRLTG